MLKFHLRDIFHTPEGPVAHMAEQGTGTARLVLHLPNGYKVPESGTAFELDSNFDHLHEREPDRFEELAVALHAAGDLNRGLQNQLDSARLEADSLRKANEVLRSTPPELRSVPTLGAGGPPPPNMTGSEILARNHPFEHPPTDRKSPELLSAEDLRAAAGGDPDAPAPTPSA